MLVPQTLSSADFSGVIVRWTVPADGSAPLLAYRVEIQGQDGGFYEEATSCDAANQAIFDALECEIPISKLLLEPFNIAWGAEINARLIAINVVGESAPSLAGSGLIILREPDAPTGLTN
jgi:hypothetical protein